MKTWNIQWHTMTYNIIWQYIMTVFSRYRWKRPTPVVGASTPGEERIARRSCTNWHGQTIQTLAQLRRTTQYYAQPILRLLNLQRTFLNIHCKSPSAAQKCHVMKLVETNLFQTQDPMPAHLARCISNVGKHQLRPRATWRWRTK